MDFSAMDLKCRVADTSNGKSRGLTLSPSN
jgi:hypothetical protein